jgi:hypothetical protein
MIQRCFHDDIWWWRRTGSVWTFLRKNLKRYLRGILFILYQIDNINRSIDNIPISPAYSVYISQLIRYARSCSTYDQVLIGASLLTNKLMSQGFLYIVSFPQILRSLQRYSLQIQPSLRPNAVWCVSYQSLSRSWYTDLDYGSFTSSWN